MNRLRAISLAALLLAVPLVQAQSAPQYGQEGAHWYFAINYATSNLQGQTPNTYTWNLASTGPGSCYPNANGASSQPFFAFGPAAHPFPELIRDYSTANSEVVTPSTTAVTGSTCSFAASTTYTHTTFWVSSGTGGLYEAIYANQKAPYPVTIFLDSAWRQYIASLPNSSTPGTVIAGIPTAFGTTNVSLVDTTTSPWTTYAWNGAAYASNGGGTPTAALGAAAGTAPTGLLATGPGSNVIVSFTSGTSTTTGTIFTLTYPSGTTSNGFNHQPVCTASSVGPTAYTLGTLTYSGTVGPGFVVTAPEVTAPLTASTFYSFKVSCN